MKNKLKQGEIYYADLPEGIGSEQTGTRPVLIVERNHEVEKSPVVTISPVTSKIKSPDMQTHIVLPRMSGLPKQSMVEVEQTTTIDKRRLKQRRCAIDEQSMKSVKRAIKRHFGL